VSGYWFRDDSDLGKMKTHLRSEHRVKHGTDYAVLSKFREVHILTQELWVGCIQDAAKKFGIKISSISIIEVTARKIVYEVGDWVYIKKYPRGHTDEIGRVDRILEDGRVRVVNTNAPFYGSISDNFHTDEIEIDSSRRTE
jgi:hypothetical protein